MYIGNPTADNSIKPHCKKLINDNLTLVIYVHRKHKFDRDRKGVRMFRPHGTT